MTKKRSNILEVDTFLKRVKNVFWSYLFRYLYHGKIYCVVQSILKIEKRTTTTKTF